MTPEELARTKASRLTDAAERRAADFAATRIGLTMLHRHGVVTRGELRAAGLDRSDIDRLVRRRSLRQIHRTVYVDHTGELTFDQRVWAAVLAIAPAVVCGRTLIAPDPAAELVDVAIDASRRVAAPDGVRVHRVRGLDAVAQWKAEPPRMRREDAVLMLVDVAATELDVVRLLTDAARSREIGVDRLVSALGRRRRLRRRAFVAALLEDVASGVHSVLEHGYLTRVERAHGLPSSTRQVQRRTPGGNQYRDVEYLDYAVVVELDGVLGHSSWEAQNRDADRDLADAAAAIVTLRLRWRQVFGTPCATAQRVATVLQQRGWRGTPLACGPACAVGVP
ncbi:type IV toxin-antitoxin system AbiEi family antitoxin domain-containing protein [Nocardioides sp. BP30]|uniref:type IV toxin-antitoxin system AbiEi family antitoxin domain-containing protein n=1 Tax=Nocardioides sp. BP30 TaxID=3036374 RepID=UPI00246877A3|nr:type IV toxin-antitoxin system AbiEi family antitoxin domain-containing protein [Nocardioides sp. BP30]WGL51946.1 type IV toxin-antitoxin system AbiEi family antitoxin domain-containing protein [Nocardioides sp. BP30]